MNSHVSRWNLIFSVLLRNSTQNAMQAYVQRYGRPTSTHYWGEPFPVHHTKSFFRPRIWGPPWLLLGRHGYHMGVYHRAPKSQASLQTHSIRWTLVIHSADQMMPTETIQYYWGAHLGCSILCKGLLKTKNKQTDTDRQTHKQTDRQTTKRQTDKQINKQTNKEPLSHQNTKQPSIQASNQPNTATTKYPNQRNEDDRCSKRKVRY